MKQLLLFTFIFLLVSCAKHESSDKTLAIEPLYGVSDPCLEGECEYVDVIKESDPTVMLRLQKYFPNYDFTASGAKEYQVGEVYTFKMSALFNQRYNAPTEQYIGGCVIEYREVQTIYKIVENQFDESGEKVFKLIFKYKRDQINNTTDTQACRDFVASDMYFNEEAQGWGEKEVYENNSSQRSFLGDGQSEKEKRNIFVIKMDGEFLLRIENKIEDEKVRTTVYNPRTRRVEKVDTVVDKKSITIQKPAKNYGIQYQYIQALHKEKMFLLNISRLADLSFSQVDASEIPQDL